LLHLKNDNKIYRGRKQMIEMCVFHTFCAHAHGLLCDFLFHVKLFSDIVIVGVLYSSHWCHV
jgi:hypothetical protein